MLNQERKQWHMGSFYGVFSTLDTLGGLHQIAFFDVYEELISP